MRTMDLEALHIFRTVVEEGGVLRAAAKLGRVQSNVTTRVRQLEERLGVRLFHKQGRTLRLSEDGRTLLQYAERLLRLADQAAAELAHGKPRGVLRLGSLESTAGVRLPAILSRYHALHPEVVVELVTGTTGALLGQLADYRIEAAFVSEPFEPAQLETMPVFAEELVLVTPKSWPRGADRDLLAAASFIAFAHGCSYRRCIEDWLGAKKLRPDRVLELASYHAIIACVAAGTGFAVVPRSVVASLRVTAGIRQHPLPPGVARNRTHLVWRGEPSRMLGGLIGIARPDAEPS